MAVGTFGEECASRHTAMIFDRGGTDRIDQLVDLNSVRWGRARSAVTDGEITLTGRSCEAQRQIIAGIEPRRHELVLFRGNERVWEGPILQVTTRQSQARIIAKDIGEYLNGTALSVDWPGPDDGGPPLMTDRIAAIIEHELTTQYTATVSTGGTAHPQVFTRWEQQDPPANLLPFLEVRAGEVLTRSATIAFEMSLGEHLANLARSGVDFTAVGRKFLVWDSAHALGRTRQLTESDFYGDPEVILSGSDFAAIYHISATRAVDETTGEQVGVGNAGLPDPYYGVWTVIHTSESEEGDSSAPTQDALNSQAQRGLVGKNPIPVELRMPDSAGLQLSHDLTINELVPGVEMPLLAELNLRKISQMQVLDKMSVVETSAGENISVTLVPSGPAQIAATGHLP
jgi:hypothetical protein